MATNNLAFDNFFSTTLSSTITASDTTVYLNALPAASEGYLVIEPDSSSNREIIYYTSKGANFVTCPSAASGRGVGGTTAVSHNSGSTVQMNTVAEMFEEIQNGNANTGMHQYFDDSFADYIKSGGAITQATGLIASVSSGVSYINGRRLTFNAFSKTLTASKDTYFDLVETDGSNIATVSYTELSSGATGSAPVSNGMHLGMVRSNASVLATIYQSGYDTLGNLLKPVDPLDFENRTTIVRQDDTTNTNVSNRLKILTGWGVKVPGAAQAGAEVVTFGVTFAQRPIVVAGGGGDNASGTLTYGAGTAAVRPFSVEAHTITTTGFTLSFWTVDGTSWDANDSVFYQWIAIGEV